LLYQQQWQYPCPRQWQQLSHLQQLKYHQREHPSDCCNQLRCCCKMSSTSVSSSWCQLVLSWHQGVCCCMDPAPASSAIFTINHHDCWHNAGFKQVRQSPIWSLPSSWQWFVNLCRLVVACNLSHMTTVQFWLENKRCSLHNSMNCFVC